MIGIRAGPLAGWLGTNDVSCRVPITGSRSWRPDMSIFVPLGLLISLLRGIPSPQESANVTGTESQGSTGIWKYKFVVSYAYFVRFSIII